jgi:hypothetical protein
MKPVYKANIVQSFGYDENIWTKTHIIEVCLIRGDYKVLLSPRCHVDGVFPDSDNILKQHTSVLANFKDNKDGAIAMAKNYKLDNYHNGRMM